MREMTHFKDAAQVPASTAEEIAQVGIIPTDDLDPIGDQFIMAGQVFVCGPEVSREEFFQAVRAANLPLDWFVSLPAGVKFQRVSTD